MQEPIELELKINVVLVGLNGDGAFGYQVDAASLASLLEATLPKHRPSLVEEQRPLNVEYSLRYDVHHQHNIDTFTKLLGQELQKRGPVCLSLERTPAHPPFSTHLNSRGPIDDDTTMAMCACGAADYGYRLRRAAERGGRIAVLL